MVAGYAEQGYLPHGLDFVQSGDLEAIITPIDFLGVNYYMRIVVGELPDTEDPFRALRGGPSGAERTDFGWEIYPDGLYNLLNRLQFDYQPPKLYITENGASFGLGPDGQGRVKDERRIGYLRSHFAAAHRAIEHGVPLAGYFVWSLLDNFEWAEGYSQRFGLVWVDYDTGRRIPKDSALWYRDVIAANGL
jgi:beta-glucosidase